MCDVCEGVKVPDIITGINPSTAHHSTFRPMSLTDVRQTTNQLEGLGTRAGRLYMCEK